MTSTLQEEIESLRDYIAGFPEDLARSAYGDVYRLRLDQLIKEWETERLVDLATRTRAPALELRMNGSRTTGGKINAGFLGELLQEWQTLTWALAQAATGRPTTRGQIPREVMERSGFDVVAFAEGSFVTRLIASPQSPELIEPLAARAIGELEELVSAGAQREELVRVFSRLGGRVLSSYVRLLRLVDVWDSTLSVSFAEPTGTEVRRMSMSPAMARETIPALRYVSEQTYSDPITVVGRLDAASLRNLSFEIFTDEETFSGRVSSDKVIAGAILGNVYQAVLVEFVRTDAMTQTTTTSWLLTALDPVQ